MLLMYRTKRTTIVVLDSWAGPLHPDYETSFPNVQFSSWQHSKFKGEPCHPHGGWVASLICQQIPNHKNVELTFVRIFNAKGGNALDELQWDETMETVEFINPDFICCSWGMADGDSPLGELTQQVMFDEFWLSQWKKATNGADVFWAAGNDDENDRDFDIDAPQKFTGDDKNQHIIGSDRFSGVPSKFSGDGPHIDAMYPGENTYSIDPTSGKWIKWSGTSAAAPSALGDIVANDIGKGEFVKAYWKAVASRAKNYLGMTKRHNKAGWGSMNFSFERNILQTGRWPSLVSRAALGIKSPITKW
jgi:hypothetical protein